MKPPPSIHKRMAPPPPASSPAGGRSGTTARGDAALLGPTPTGLVVQVPPPSRDAGLQQVPPPPRSQPTPGAAEPSGARCAEQLVGNMLDGRFIVDGVLGEGGMGTVYSGRDLVDSRRVAIKVLRADFLSDSEIVQRFLNEAQAASQIGSPHICGVFGVGGAPNGAAYFVMEFLDGSSLSGILQRERVVAIRRILRIGQQIASGLSTAHEAGIIHRDLKPDNIMLIERNGEQEFVKIVDFGVAKIASSHSKLTRAGSVFGTPQYMSPEQAAGAVVDARADIYSLGIILYEMAAGCVPFDDENMMNVLTHQMFRDPLAVRDVAPQVVPAEFDAIVRKCLQKDPKLRFESMQELADELERTGRVLPSGQFETVIPDSKRPFTDQAARGLSATVLGLPRAHGPGHLRFWVAGALAALTVVGVVVYARDATREMTAEMPAFTPAVEPPPAAPSRTVTLEVTPATAVVTHDGVELPATTVGSDRVVTLVLAASETASVQVTAPGYSDRTVAVGPELGPRVRVPLSPRPSAIGSVALEPRLAHPTKKVRARTHAPAAPAPAKPPADAAQAKCNPGSPGVDVFGKCVR